MGLTSGSVNWRAQDFPERAPWQIDDGLLLRAVRSRCPPWPVFELRPHELDALDLLPTAVVEQCCILQSPVWQEGVASDPS